MRQRLVREGRAWIRQQLKSRSWRRTIGRFFDGVEHPEPNNGGVLQYVGIGSMYLTPLEILIHHLLQRKGFAVDYLIYGADPLLNEITTHSVCALGLEQFWSRSFQDARNMLKHGQVNYRLIPQSDQARQLASEPRDLDQLLRFKHDGIEFGNIVQGSLYRYYKSLEVDQQDLQVGRRMLETALRNYLCIKQQCETHRYKFVMFSHGIYVTWQPVVEYCRRNGIDFVCYDRAKTRNTANFNVNQPSPDWNFDPAWQRYSDRELSSAESKSVDTSLSQRESQRGDVYSYNPTPKSEDIQREKSRLGIPQAKQIVTIFTNLVWDAANVSRDIAFANCLDCIRQSILKFADNDRVQLVVRSHPAEKVLGTQQRYGTLVRQNFGDTLPSNVTIVEPDDQINSFTMIEMSDIGVVNTSTVGLEMAMMGKPVVLISETHYRGKGFTYDAQSPDDFFRQLESQLQHTTLLPDQVQLARKYFFMMMALYQQEMPTRHGEDGGFSGYTSDRFDELNDDEPIVRIIDAVTNGVPSDFVRWDSV